MRVYVNESIENVCILTQKDYNRRDQTFWLIAFREDQQGEDRLNGLEPEQAIRTSKMRREMKGRPLEELHKRNNVEATIFQLSFSLRNNKSKYRGHIKQKMWACCRYLWINLVRILNFTKQICQRTFKTMELSALAPVYSGYPEQWFTIQSILGGKLAMALYLSIASNFFILS